MKELPLISTDYPSFDWNSSNGSATAEQTQRAYIAVTSEGQTSDFSRFVWNDLVDKLLYLVAMSGSTWDSTYATYSNTLINEQYGPLTAKRFNSVTYNIEKLIGTNWKWSFDKNLIGYLGRSRVIGVAESPKNSDIVYGWYIVELVRVVNLLIEILKNEADFGELAFEADSNSGSDSDMFKGIAGLLFSDGASNSSTNGDLFKAIAGILSAEESISHSSSKTDLYRALSVPCEASSTSHSISVSDLFKVLAGEMKSKAESGTNTSALIKELIYAARLAFKGSSFSQVSSNMTFQDCIEVVAKRTSYSQSNVELDYSEGLPTKALVGSQSCIDSVLDYAIATYIDSKVGSVSYSGVILDIAELIAMASRNASCSYATAKATIPYSMLLYVLDFSCSTAVSELLNLKAMQLKTSEQSWSTANSICTLANLQAIELKNGSSSSSNSSVERMSPSYVISQQSSASSCDSEITKSTPKYLITDVVSNTTSSSVLDELEAFAIESQSWSATTKLATLLRRAVKNIVVSATSKTSVRSSLVFYTKPVEVWSDPIQTGSDLYIRSAYPQWQEDSNMHLDDSGVFYDPIQTGSDLYIRSNESMKEVAKNG